jgi:hypothetical protein
MSTPGAWLTLAAALVFVGGIGYSVWRPRLPRMAIGLIATLLLTGTLGWLAWFSTTAV